MPEAGGSMPPEQRGRLARCVFAPVDLRSDEVANFRRRFDSLYGKCPPHVTLAFPFVSDVSDEALAKVLEAAARARGAFDITLLAPQLDSGTVLLPVAQPDPWLSETFLELSRLLGARPADGYRPHVTIGRNMPLAYTSELASLPSSQHARIDRLILEEIQQDDSSHVLHEAVLG